MTESAGSWYSIAKMFDWMIPDESREKAGMGEKAPMEFRKNLMKSS